MQIVDDLLAIYGRRGAEAYFGECVSVTEHALQSAHFAQRAKVPAALIVAALLHDIGHLIESVPDEISDWTHDARHEVSGARWLAAHFGPEVSEPVRLHVAAKRYLCAAEPDYFAKLSKESVRSLALQGGPMSRAEVEAFETEPFFRQAVMLRQWDDQGKIANFPTPDFAHYAPLIERLAKA